MNSGQPSPSWPSLYNPAVEIIHINDRNPIQHKGVYLHEPDDIFRFTLYWTLVFNTPIFVICGVYAFLNLSFPPKSGKKSGHRLSYDQLESDDDYESPILGSFELPESPGSAAFPLSPFSGRAPLLPQATPVSPGIPFSSTNSTAGFTHRKRIPHSSRTREQRPRTGKTNARRSRLTFALLVLLSFLALSLIGSVLSSAVVGFILLGLFKAGGFFMSTWIPFLWALIHTLVGLLSIWPSVIDII